MPSTRARHDLRRAPALRRPGLAQQVAQRGRRASSRCRRRGRRPGWRRRSGVIRRSISRRSSRSCEAELDSRVDHAVDAQRPEAGVDMRARSGRCRPGRTPRFGVRNGLIPGTSKLVPDASDGAAVAGSGSVTSPRAAAAAEPPKPWRTAPPTAATAPTATAVCRKPRRSKPAGRSSPSTWAGSRSPTSSRGLPSSTVSRACGRRAESSTSRAPAGVPVAGSVVGVPGRVRRGAQGAQQQEQRDGADHEQGQGGQHPQHDTGGRGAVGDSRHHRDQAEGDEAAQGEPRAPYPDGTEEHREQGDGEDDAPDQHRLVVRAEPLDRELLERARGRVDGAVADRQQRRGDAGDDRGDGLRHGNSGHAGEQPGRSAGEPAVAGCGGGAGRGRLGFRHVGGSARGPVWMGGDAWAEPGRLVANPASATG